MCLTCQKFRLLLISKMVYFICGGDFEPDAYVETS